MAQGRKIPSEIWKEFLNLYAENLTSAMKVCEVLKISPNAFYNKCRTDSVFAEKIRKIKEEIRIAFAEDILHSLIRQGNLGAIKYFLSNQGGRTWNNSKIIPIVVKHEVYNPPPEESIRQGAPDHIAMITAQAYEDAMMLGLDEIPEKLTLDLRHVIKKIRDPKQRKKILDDNPDTYAPDESRFDTGEDE